MTAKRFHKLCRAEMTIFLKDSTDIGMFIYSAAHANPFLSGKYKSYQEAWDALRSLFETDEHKPSKR